MAAKYVNQLFQNSFSNFVKFLRCGTANEVEGFRKKEEGVYVAENAAIILMLPRYIGDSSAP